MTAALANRPKSTRPAGLPEPVTPWRKNIAQLADEIVCHITSKADPEDQHEICSRLTRDMMHQVEQHLKHNHGRTFNRLFDGPDAA